MRSWALALAMFMAASGSVAEPFPGLPRLLTFPKADLTMAEVQNLEQFMPPLPGAWPFPRYDRFYALEQRDGGRVVVGLFLLRPAAAGPGTIHIQPQSEWLQVADGGCSVVHLRWEPASAPMYWCNGVG